MDVMGRDYLKYIASLLLFGSNGIVASQIDVPSAEVVVLRTSLGAGLLLFLLLASHRKPTLHRSPRDLALVVGSGIAMGVCWAFVYMAYREVGVGVTSLLYALGPVMVMAASPLLFGERLTIPACACFATVLTGAVLVNGPVAAGGDGSLGLVHGLVAAVAYAAMIVLCKKTGSGSGLECSAVQLGAATCTALVSTVLQGIELVPVPAGSILPALMLGLVNTGIGCHLYFSSIGNLSAQTVAVCDYVEPLTALMLSAAVLGETLAVPQWLGAALVMVGAVSCELARRRKSLALCDAEQAAGQPGTCLHPR